MEIINPYLSRVYAITPSISIKELSTNQWTGSIFEKKPLKNLHLFRFALPLISGFRQVLVYITKSNIPKRRI